MSERGQQGPQTQPSENAPHVILTREELPITQTEPAQYLHDSQSDSDQDFDVTTVNPSTDSMRMDGAQSRPQDGHAPHHAKLKADSMDQHVHQAAPGDLQATHWA